MKTTFTKKFSTFILLFSGMFSLSFVNVQSPRNVQTINPIIGDISFLTKFGHQPNATTNEDLRIKTHLEFVENLLRQKDVSNLSLKVQQKRTHMLNLLHDYWTRGVFPRNYDYKDTRKPCFIDKDNTICAVGYLVEQTAGREAAEAINNKYKYDYIFEMNDKGVNDWISNSGLSKEECAMIQPSYGSDCPKNKTLAYRYSHCKWESKCMNPNNVAKWIAQAVPCNAKVNNKNSGGAIIAEADKVGEAATIYFLRMQKASAVQTKKSFVVK